MSQLLCSCAGRRRRRSRRRGSSSSSRTPTPTPRAQRRRNFPRDDVLRVPPAGGPWTPGSKRDPQPPRIVHPFPDVVAGQVGTSESNRPPQPRIPPPVSTPPETRECSRPPPAATEPSAPTEMELSSVRSSTSDEGSLPVASRERLAHSRETLRIDADLAPLASGAPLTGSAPTRASCGSLRKAARGSSNAVDDPCCKDSGDVWVKMDPSSAVLPRRKISARSPATSVDQVWSKAGARRRLYDSGTAWSAEDFTDRGDDIWVKAKTAPKPTDRPEQQNEKEPVANERLLADRLQSVSDSPGTSSQGAKGKSLTLDRGSAVKLKSGAKEERSSFLNWLWTLFRSKRKDAKDESAPCSSKTQEGASASNETALRTEEKPSVKGEKVLGEAARAVLTGSDFRLIDDEGGDVYEDACDGGILPDAALNQGQDDVAINPEIAKRLEDIDEVLKAVYERNIAYGRSVSMQRLGVSPGYKYQGDSREGSREADGDKSSSHLSLSRVGERTALLTEGDTSHKCHEKKISVGSSSPSSYYSHSRSESELTNDDEFLALGAPPPPPKVKPSQAGYMRLSEPNFSNAECARFKVGRFLQQSNDEQWFGHSDQSLEGRQTGHHEAVSNTDDTNSATVLGERSAAVEDKLLSLTSTFDEGVRAIRKDIEQCLASTQQFSPSEASAAFISEERNNSRILRRSTPPTLLVTEEVEENDRDLSGFTDDGLDDILKISSNTDVEADEWEGFDPAAWSRARGFVMPADSACYTSILPSGKQLVDVRQGEVEGAARDESWADIQRALQQLVDSQDSALLQELKKAPEDETPLEPVSEETDLTKTEDVSLPETSLMFADSTSAISHPVSSTQLSQSENDSPQTYLTKGNDIVCSDATRSPATVGDIGIPHPFESMQQVQSQDDRRHHLDEETVTAPKDPKHDLNSEKGKQDPQTETQPMLQSQFQEVLPVIGPSVVSPVTKESLAPDNIESFFDEAFDRPELPLQPAEQPMADVSCLSQGGGESLQGNLHTVSAVNVFTLSDETLNNLRSAAQNIKKSAAVDLMTPSEELVDAKLETPEGPSVDVLEEFHVSQGRIETPLDTIQDIIINKVPQKPLDAQNRASSSLQKLLPGSFSTGCTDELHKEAEICCDTVSLTEPVTSDSQDSACSQLRNVALQYSNLQESLISLKSKEKDSRDKADSMSLDSLINHDIPKFHQVEKEHSLLGNQQQQYQSVPDVTKTSEALQRENSLLESADFSDEPYTTKAIDEFLGVDLSEKKEINILATEEKTAISEKAVTDQPGNLTWTDTASESFYQFGEDWGPSSESVSSMSNKLSLRDVDSNVLERPTKPPLTDVSSDSFCHFAEDWGLSSASASNMSDNLSRRDVDSKMLESPSDTSLTQGWPLPSECRYEHKLAEVDTPGISTVSQLSDVSWQAAQSEEKAPNTVEIPPVVSTSLTYQSNETELSVDNTNSSRDPFEKPESGGKVGSPFDVLEEFVEVSTSSQLHNLKEQSHGLRDLADQMQCLKEQTPASKDTISHLKSLKEQSHDLSSVAGDLQKLKEEYQDTVGKNSEAWIQHEADQSNAFRVTMGKTVDTGFKTASGDISADSVWLPLDRSLEDLKTPAVSFPPDLSSTSALLPSVDPLPDLQMLKALEGGDCNRFDMRNNKIENPFMGSNSVPQKEDTPTEKSGLMFSGQGVWDSPNALDSAWFPSENKFFADDSCSEIKAHSDYNKNVPTSDKGCGSQQEREWWSEKGFDSLDPFGMADFSFTEELKSETPQQWDSYVWTGELLSSNTSSSTPTDVVKAFSIDDTSYGRDEDPFSVASKENASVSAIKNSDIQQKLFDDPLDKSSTISSTLSEISPTASSQFPKESVYTEQQQIQPVTVTEQPSCDEAAVVVNDSEQKAPVSKLGTVTPRQDETTSSDPVESYKPSLTNMKEMCVAAIDLDSDSPKRLHSIGDDIVASKTSKTVCEEERRRPDDSETLAPVADVKTSVEELTVRSRSDSPPPLVDLSPSDTTNTLDLPEAAGSVVEEQHQTDHFTPEATAAAPAGQAVVSLVKSTELPASEEFSGLAAAAADTSHATEAVSGAKGTSVTAKTSSDSSTKNHGVAARAIEKSVTSGDSPLETDSYSEDSVFLDDEEGGDVLGKAGFILHPITRQLIRRSSSVSLEPLSPTIMPGALTVTPENMEDQPLSAAEDRQVLGTEDATEKTESAGRGDAVAKPATAERRESVVLEKISALKHHISEGIQHGKESVYSTERKLMEKVHSWMTPAEKPSGKVAEKVLVEEEDVTENEQTKPAVSDVLKTEQNKSTITAAPEAENKLVEKRDEKMTLLQTPSLHTSDSETEDKVADNQDEQVNIPESSPPNVKTGTKAIMYAGPALKINDTLQTMSLPKEGTNFKEGSVGKVLVENRAAMETIPLTPEGDTIIEMDDFEYETIVVDRDPLLGQEFTIVVKSGSDSEQSSSHSKTGFRSPQRLQASGSNDGTSDFHKNELPTCITGHFKNSEADSHRTTDGSNSPVGSDRDFFFDDIPQQSLEYGTQTPNPFLYEEDGSDDADVECGDSSRPATSSSDDWYFSTSRSVDGGLAISYGPPSNASSRMDLRKQDNLDTAEAGNSAENSNVKEKDASLHETHLKLPATTHKQSFLDVQHVDLKPLSGEASPGGRSCASYDGPDYYDIEKRIDSVLKRIDALQESDPTFREPDSGISGTNPFDMSEEEWVCTQPQEGFAELPEEPTVEGCGSTVEEDQRFLEETYLNTRKKSGRLQRVCTRQNLDGKEDLDANPFSIATDGCALSSGSVLSSSSSIPETCSDSGDQERSNRSNPFLQTIYEKGLLSQSALSIDLPNPFLYTEAEIREQLRRAGFSSEEEIFPLSPPGGMVSEASSGVAGDRSCSPDSTSSDSSEGTLVQDPLPVLPVPTQEVLLPARTPDGGAIPLKGFSECKETESTSRDLDDERVAKEVGTILECTTEGSELRGTGAQEVRSSNLPDVVSKDVSINQATNSSDFQKQTSSDLQKGESAHGLPHQVCVPFDVHPSKLAVGISGLSVRTETGFQGPSRFSVTRAVENPGLDQVGSDNGVFPGDKQCSGIDSHAKECVRCRLPKDATESVVAELPDLVGTACSVAVEGGGGQLVPQDSAGTSNLQQQLRQEAAATNETPNDGGQPAAGALDLAQNSNVQDAFVIAVEQQARERLERLSALKRIKPVDMTKLSQQLNQQAQAESEQQQLSQQQQQQLNGFIESSPIYVTSLQSQAPPTATASRAKQAPPTTGATKHPSKAGSGALSNGHAPQPSAQSQSEDSGDTLELKQELSDDQDQERERDRERDQRPAANTTVTTAIVEAPAHEQLIDNNAGSR